MSTIELIIVDPKAPAGPAVDLAPYRAMAGGPVRAAIRSYGYAASSGNAGWVSQWNRLLALEAAGDSTWYMASSSGFPSIDGASSVYVPTADVNTALARPLMKGLYVTELVAYWASLNSFNWTTGASLVDYAKLNTWAQSARANGKKVVWAEPAEGWAALKLNATALSYFASWADVLVPMYASNFDCTASGFHMDIAAKAVTEVAAAYAMPLGMSVQDWYFNEEPARLPFSRRDVIALCEHGRRRGCTYFEIEGADMAFTTTALDRYMNGVSAWCELVRNGAPLREAINSHRAFDHATARGRFTPQ